MSAERTIKVRADEQLPEALKGAFVRRPDCADKYAVGTVLVAGGSERYPHAPILAGLGARSAGAGLVQLMVPDASRFAAGALLPEATFVLADGEDVLPRTDVFVVGMGLGRSRQSVDRVVRLLTHEKGRFVLDADALFVLATLSEREIAQMVAKGNESVLTPHEGEAARLLGWTREAVHESRLEAAREIARRYQATVVLKGHATVAVSQDGKRVYENRTGNPFMALGGMGDLLAGVIGARWAFLKGDAFLASASGAWLHGFASDSLVRLGGNPSLVNTAEMIGSLRASLDSAC